MTVIVTREDGAVLLIRRSDNGNWALPGGAIELRESVADAAVRETREETGIDCQVTGMAGVYSDPRHLIHYLSNDEVRREFAVAVTARPVSGRPETSEESLDVRWVSPENLPGYPMDRAMRKRLEDYLRSGGTAVLA